MTALEFPLLPPAEILALEEVLLDAAEAGELGETLSFWQSPAPFVVLGYGNKVAAEVNRAACERLNIPILRRISGGGTVLQGPGVLNYSLILRAAEDTPLASINGANRFIMERNAAALTELLNTERGTGNTEQSGGTFKIQHSTSNAKSGPNSPPPDPRREPPDPELTVTVQGHTDLAIAGRKFSGNAQRRKRTHLLFHGSILLNADLKLIEQVLPFPSLQPDYRQSRSHADFLTQFPALPEQIKRHLTGAWEASPGQLENVMGSQQRVERLRRLAEKYLSDSWNLRA